MPATPMLAFRRTRTVALGNSLQWASNGLTIALSERWRIAGDELQWLLQYRDGNRWANRSYCVTRAGLLRCIREHCGVVCADALAQVRGLPDWHPDRAGANEPPKAIEPLPDQKVRPRTFSDTAPPLNLLPEGSYRSLEAEAALTYDAAGQVELPGCLDRGPKKELRNSFSEEAA